MDEARFATLIRRHLPFYLALAEGRRSPSTPAQRHFVAVARGEAPPRTEHEHAFVLWRRRAHRAAHALDTQAARVKLIPDARSRAQTRLGLKPTPPPRKP
jgi:uncharacterized protein YifE (UPF0438 family)